jgi:hypothetical protein
MISNDQELKAAMERIARFQQQVMRVREAEISPGAYEASAGGFLAEIDRMMLEVREYLWQPPAATHGTRAAA